MMTNTVPSFFFIFFFGGGMFLSLATDDFTDVCSCGFSGRSSKTYERLNISIIIPIASGRLCFSSPVYSMFNSALTVSFMVFAGNQVPARCKHCCQVE